MRKSNVVQISAAPRHQSVRSVRLDDELWDALGKLGVVSRRSRSNLINVAIDEYMRLHSDELKERTN